MSLPAGTRRSFIHAALHVVLNAGCLARVDTAFREPLPVDLDRVTFIPPVIPAVFAAFEDLKQDHFVYLPYFLEHYVARNPNLVDVVSALARNRNVDFHSETRPSVSNPFPQPTDTEQFVTGTLDSFTPKRKDLLHSSDFLRFQTAGGRTSIEAGRR